MTVTSRLGRTPAAMVATVAAALALAATSACSSSGKPAPSPRPTATTNAATLADQVRAGLADVTSAHLDVDLGSLGGKSSEDVAFADGKASAWDITMPTSAGVARVVTVHGKSYAKLPPSQNTSGKPWVLVNSKSTNPAVTRLAGGLSLARATASLDAIAGYIQAAKSVSKQGSEQINAAPATRYRLLIAPEAVTGNAELKQVLQLLGKSEIPVELWVDDHGRPVQFSVHLTVSGQKISIFVRASKYNAPLHITAPPADQVSAG